MPGRRVYVAASWRTPAQPAVVEKLRQWGHEVYDFRDHGFGWKQVTPVLPPWAPETYLNVLRHPVARQGFWRDLGALAWCDALILVMPAGRSACAEYQVRLHLGLDQYCRPLPLPNRPSEGPPSQTLITPFLGALEDWLSECPGVVE